MGNSDEENGNTAPGTDGYGANNGDGSIASPGSGGNVATTSGDDDGPNLTPLASALLPKRSMLRPRVGGQPRALLPATFPTLEPGAAALCACLPASFPDNCDS